MKTHSWKELNLAVKDLLNSIPKDSTKNGTIWREVRDKLCGLSISDGVTGYYFFSKEVANFIIKKHLEEKFK